jgi:hypothetical protein
VTVEELITALSNMPVKDEVLIFDGRSQRANFCQEVSSVRMSDDLSCVIIEA